MILPDYDNSVLSTVASILKRYGGESRYPSIPELDALMRPAPKHVVMLLLDGMGQLALDAHLPEDSFLRRNLLRTVTAVFPSTTAASTTAYYAAQSPNEHGWLGWSLYFKECAQQLDVFQGLNSYTKEKYAPLSPAYTYMPFETIFERIHRHSGGSVHTVSVFPFPSECDRGADVRARYDNHSLTGLLNALEAQLRIHKGDSFLFGYWTEPDHEEHMSGPYSEQSRDVFRRMNDAIEAFARRLEGTDTVLILSADHGLRGPQTAVYLHEIPEIMDCLIMPPSIEARACSFFVKPHRKAQFEREFRARFGDSFILYTREQVLDMQLFGRGQTHPKVDDFLGDYLACAIGDIYIDYLILNQRRDAPKFVGAHAGLTEEEMLVPVVALRV